jgi:amino acid adenylation domain-containing protein
VIRKLVVFMQISATAYDSHRHPDGFSGQTLADLLDFRAEHHPDDVGYTFLVDRENAGSTLTYGELQRRAAGIAARISECECPGERALLLYPPGLDFLAAFFGCIYAKAIAVPAYPPHRNRHLLRLQAIIADAKPTTVLTTSALVPKIREQLAQLGYADRVHSIATDALTRAGGCQRPDLSADDLAFLQYTSGSTGEPKGVMLTHRNLLHNAFLVHYAVEHCHDDSYVSWLPTFHDMGFMAGVLQPLYGGLPCVQMAATAFLEEPIRWLRAISDYRATASGGPNFAYDLCVSKISEEQRETLDLSSWSVAFNGAEPVRADTLERFVRAFQSCGFRKQSFYPCYGLAEATLMVTGSLKSQPAPVLTLDKRSLEKNRVTRSDDAVSGTTLVGCGRNLPDQEIAIVHPDSLEECKTGVIGEIWVKGPSVAKGYWNRPAESGAQFETRLANSDRGPFLRTGDVGVIEDGTLYIAGRLKDVLIIRGQNHYPQDIELTVERCDARLRPGCGAAFSIDLDAEERLVIVQEVARRSDTDLDEVVRAIRRSVAENHELAPYAVVLIRAGSIPKTSSGKIQRQACKTAFLQGKLNPLAKWQEHEIAGSSVPKHEAAGRPGQGEATAWLIAEVAKMKGTDPGSIDPAQPISAYGLDSLAAVELAHKIQQKFGIDVSPATLFERLNFAEVCAIPQHPLEAADEVENFPLSHGQKALWFLHQMYPESPTYNISRAFRIRSSVDAGALQRSFAVLVERHRSLRSSFLTVDGEPLQKVHSRPVEFFECIDASGWTVRELELALEEQSQKPFDLTRGPVLRVRLHEGCEGGPVLHIAVHHIVADLWSLATLLNELGAIYSSVIAGNTPLLPPLETEYADFVRWQQALIAGLEGDRLRSFWKSELAGIASDPELLADYCRTPARGFRGSSQQFTIDKETAEALKALGSRHNATLFMVLLAAFQVLLQRLSGHKQIVVGSPTAGRHKSQFAGVVGYFVNPVPLRADFECSQTFEEFLARVRATVVRGFEHDSYPFRLMVEDVRRERDPISLPLVQTIFVFQKVHSTGSPQLVKLALGAAGARIDVGNLQLESIALVDRSAQFDLTLAMGEAEDGLMGSMQYRSDLFKASTVEGWVEGFRELLRSITANAKCRVHELPVMTERARMAILKFNRPSVEGTSSECLHDLFAQQANLRPEQVAIVCGKQVLSYGELEARSNQLARYLRRLGIRSEDRIGICLRRSPDMVIAMLAISKAGGAYVPLDPEYPNERLTFVLNDAAVNLVITERSLRSRLPGAGAGVVCLDEDESFISREAVEPFASPVSPEQIAYIIYTSGSTGVPKGVMIEHRNAVSFVRWARSVFSADDLRVVLASTSVCFDLSVFELWAPLCSGGRVILADSILDWWETTRNAQSECSVTIVNTVPSSARALIEQGWRPDGVRQINLAGEPLSASLVNAIYSSARTTTRVNNLYGPTETTTYSTWTPVEADSTITIGCGVGATTLYVLDEYEQMVPIGVFGELYIGGPGVARGYWKRPELTAERFIPDPHSMRPGERMYRTGDLVRWRTDGQLEYLGRADHQVKVRGFRIELDEIAAVLNRREDLLESVVVVKGGEHDPRLAAYVVPRNGATPTPDQLHKYLQRQLPCHMVPSEIITLGQLPKTQNGKVDRKALSEAEGVEASRPIQAPRNDIEAVVAAIWAEVLGLGAVGVEDDLFLIGGHSLLAIKIKARVEQRFQVKIPIRRMFECPTVAAMAQTVQSGLTACVSPRIPRLPRGGGNAQRLMSELSNQL